MHPFLGKTTEIDKKFKQVVAQKENRRNLLDAKILFPDGARWVKCVLLFIQKGFHIFSSPDES